MSIPLTPLGDHVIVKAIQESKTTASGIVLPDTVEKEHPEKGEVLAVGEGKLLENGSRASMSVKAGDKVIFKKYSPDKFKFENAEFLVIKEEEIIAVIK